MASISLKNIVKRYGTGKTAVPVIHGINVEINDGEFIVLVGPSGCGKSTLLRMIAGLEEITDGDLLIGDKKVNDLEPAKRNIAMVFQNYALYPHMTNYENMAYGLKLAKVPEAEIKQRVDKAAKILELSHLLTASPSSSPAASASAWPWAAPSCANPRSSCLTSRCPTWTPSCAAKPVWKSRSCTPSWASPACS